MCYAAVATPHSFHRSAAILKHLRDRDRDLKLIDELTGKVHWSNVAKNILCPSGSAQPYEITLIGTVASTVRLTGSSSAHILVELLPQSTNDVAHAILNELSDNNQGACNTDPVNLT